MLASIATVAIVAIEIAIVIHNANKSGMFDKFKNTRRPKFFKQPDLNVLTEMSSNKN